MDKLMVVGGLALGLGVGGCSSRTTPAAECTAPSLWYVDADGDGYGNPLMAAEGCDALPAWVDNGDDCNDADAAINPGTDCEPLPDAWVDGVAAADMAADFDIPPPACPDGPAVEVAWIGEITFANDPKAWGYEAVLVHPNAALQASNHDFADCRVVYEAEGDRRADCPDCDYRLLLGERRGEATCPDRLQRLLPASDRMAYDVSVDSHGDAVLAWGDEQSVWGVADGTGVRYVAESLCMAW